MHYLHMPSLAGGLLVLTLVLCPGTGANAQANVGINTANPARSLDVQGTYSQYLRAHDSGNLGGEAGLELTLGTPASGIRDFRLTNDAGDFSLQSATDNFMTTGTPVWHFDYLGRLGMGTTQPLARLHLSTVTEASNATAGMLTIGSISGKNLVFDNNEIIARNNGSASSFQIQGNDQPTFIGEGGGHVYLAGGGGKVGVGTSSPDAPLTVESDGFQLGLRNQGTGLNDWYIAASDATWLVGDNQLIFSPTTASSDAALRLLAVTENDGTQAPVMIRSSASQSLLMDGNEIDCELGPLYINYNSDENTLFNAQGGRVGIGTDEPTTTMHVKTSDTDVNLRLQRNSIIWDVDVNTTFNWLGFNKNGYIVGRADGVTGQWLTISDRTAKQDIRPLEPVLARLRQPAVYRYTYRSIRNPRPQIGLIAQDVDPLFPEITDRDGELMSIAYSKLSVLLLRALQEQQAEIDVLSRELDMLLSE